MADKVAAMYERQGSEGRSASNRWRDLDDMVLLVVDSGGLDAADLTRALAVRERVARNPLTLPPAMNAPGPERATGYPPVRRPADTPRAAVP
jgi:hypothetical protein